MHLCEFLNDTIAWKKKHSSEWVSNCCLTPTQQFFSYIMARTSQFSTRWWWGPLCTRPTGLGGFL
jgi:hypothetical protein